MLTVILHRPEIPPNTGNIIRLCANTGTALALIEPLGFAMDERRLRRAGLDYREYASVTTYQSLDACLADRPVGKLWAFTTRASRNHTDATFSRDDALLFGAETSGLPDDVRAAIPPDDQLRIPMVEQSRSLNLSNAVAIAVYEAWRQLGYE